MVSTFNTEVIEVSNHLAIGLIAKLLQRAFGFCWYRTFGRYLPILYFRNQTTFILNSIFGQVLLGRKLDLEYIQYKVITCVSWKMTLLASLGSNIPDI